jgi:hypothetical protein
MMTSRPHLTWVAFSVIEQRYYSMSGVFLKKVPPYAFVLFWLALSLLWGSQIDRFGFSASERIGWLILGPVCFANGLLGLYLHEVRSVAIVQSYEKIIFYAFVVIFSGTLAFYFDEGSRLLDSFLAFGGLALCLLVLDYMNKKLGILNISLRRHLAIFFLPQFVLIRHTLGGK